tara:strand:+ start:392 stop:556 length:165 start_codon:yes stop_codon:yes gene_type:complete
MPRPKRDNTVEATGTWTTSNVTTDRSIDANGAVAEIGDGLTTLIEDLKTLGVIA